MWNIRFFVAFLLTMTLLSLRAEIVTDGTIGPQSALQGPDFAIDADLGRQAGGNLFHSFETFNLYSGERALFTGPASVSNVISRVTGGASFLDGLIRSSIPGADFYFFNPAGIAFAENARLDVSGSFHAAAADVLYFQDGEGRFDAVEPEKSVFSSAPPGAFGFLSEPPAGLSVHGAFLEVPDYKTLSFSGGDMTLRNSTLYAPDGEISLVSTASAGRIAPGVFNVMDKGGDIRISHEDDAPLHKAGGAEMASLDVTGINGGRIFIQGGNFIYAASNVGISAQTLAASAEIKFNEPSLKRGIAIHASEELNISGSPVSTLTRSSVDGADIELEGGRVILDGFLMSDTRSSGNGGNIDIRAGTVELRDNSGISAGASCFGPFCKGNSGNIRVNAESLYLDDSAVLSTTSVGNAASGNIEINVNTLLNKGTIASRSVNKDAGFIEIRADDFTMDGGGGFNFGYPCGRRRYSFTGKRDAAFA